MVKDSKNYKRSSYLMVYGLEKLGLELRYGLRLELFIF